MDLFFLEQLDINLKITFLLVIALSMGSFASLVSYRLAHDESIFITRSKCPACNHKLALKNLIPLFSWLIQRGKCSICAAKISIRYPVIEVAFGLVFLIIFFAGGKKIDPKMLLIMAISTVMIIMIITDLEHYFIPNCLQYSLAILATILNIHLIGINQTIHSFYPAFAYASFAMLLLIIFLLLTKKEAIGIDDIKFFFIAGFMLGFNKFFTFLLLTGLGGTIFGSLWIKFKQEKIFPFAPAICLASFICLLFEKKVNPLNLFGAKLAKLLF